MTYTSLQFMKLDWILLAAAVAAGASLYLLWRYKKASVFFFLRLAALAVLTFMAASPVLVRFITAKKPVLAVAVDTSASMSITKRTESAAAFISKYRNQFDNAADVRLYSIASNASGVSSASGILNAPRGKTTDLNNPLWEIARENGDNLSGIILITDGNHNAGSLKENWLAGLGAPVFTVSVGSGKKIKDVAVTSLRVSDFAFKNVPLEITASVSACGYAGKTVVLRLKGGPNPDEILAVKPLQLSSDNETRDTALTYTPPASGNFSYTVEAEALPGEITAANNSKTLSLNVIRDKLRVLFLSGNPSFEYSFLRHALKNDPMVELVSFVILRNPENIMIVSDDQSSLIPFPAADLFNRDIYTFDLLILDNFSYKKIGVASEYFFNIRDWITNKGGGLIMNAGPNSFSAGGWNTTAVDDILPADSLPGEAGLSEGIFRPRVSDPSNYITLLTDNRKESEALWKSMPGLDGSQALKAKTGAETVLENTSGGPVLVVWDKGKGRAAALGVNTTWRWALQSGTVNVYNAFWKNMVRYATRSGKADEWIISFDRPEYYAGLDYAVRIRRPFEARYDKLWLNVTSPSGARSASPLKKTGKMEWQYSGKFPSGGVYKYELASSLDGASKHELVFEKDVAASAAMEEVDLNTDETVLKKMAYDTGGRYYDEYNFSLAELFDKLRKIKQKTVLEKAPISSSGAWLIIIAALLIFEWILRRKKGLW